MKTEFLESRKSPWNHEVVAGCDIWLRGMFRWNGTLYRGGEGCRQLARMLGNIVKRDICLSGNEIISVLRGIHGHFSFVVKSSRVLLAVVDRIRAFPLFYSMDNGVCYLSCSATKIKTRLNLGELDQQSALEFNMAGYVLGKRTLLKGLFQLQAGEALIVIPGEREPLTRRYYRYLDPARTDVSGSSTVEQLSETMTKVTSELVKSLDGHPVWIPLSGGLDSRLVLALLVEAKYDKLACFTYGMRGIWDVKQARFVTEKLGVKWFYIPYTAYEARKMFHKREYQDYFAFADGASSVPFISEYYALVKLRERDIIPDDAIIINGQTGDYISGGHIPKTLNGIADDYVNVNLLLEKIIEKHFSLWSNLNTDSNIDRIQKEVSALLGLSASDKLEKAEFTRLFETFEWQERQSKYVVNGQRVYEWFGFNWRLPLWDDCVLDFWDGVNWRDKLGQGLFLRYLREVNPAGIFNVKSFSRDRYQPTPVWLVNKIFALLGRLPWIDPNRLVNKYTRRFMFYAPFYPQSYMEYLRDSEYHRSPISYLARNVLERYS